MIGPFSFPRAFDKGLLCSIRTLSEHITLSYFSSSIHTFENKQNETIHMAYQDQIQRKNYMWQMAMQS